MKKFIALALIVATATTVYGLTSNNKELCNCSETAVCTVTTACKCTLCIN